MVYDRTELVGKQSYEVARMGLKYIDQDKHVFLDLTVRENLELSSYATGDYDWDKVFKHFPKLKILIDRKGAYLSGGERQMLMVGRAILGDPKVLLIDEPTEGLAPSIVDDLVTTFHELSKDCAILTVGQNLSFVSRIAERIYAMKEGNRWRDWMPRKLKIAVIVIIYKSNEGNTHWKGRKMKRFINSWTGIFIVFILLFFKGFLPPAFFNGSSDL